ncbi:MAG: hypothetical protein AAB468_00595 [Patescibacteria group bacterium]
MKLNQSISLRPSLLAMLGFNVFGLAILIGLIWLGQKEWGRIGGLATEITIGEEKARYFQRLVEISTATAAGRATLANNFITDDRPEIAGFLDQLESVLGGSGVVFSVRVVEPNAAGGYLDLQFDATGSFAQLHQLITVIETWPLEIVFDEMLLSTEGVSATASTSTPATRRWRGSFKAKLLGFEFPNV